MPNENHPSFRSDRKKKKLKVKSNTFEGTNEEVLRVDIKRLLADYGVPEFSGENSPKDVLSEPSSTVFVSPERFSEIEVEILELSSTGDGLALSSTRDHVFVVPFSVPGDVVKAKTVHYIAQDRYTVADFLAVITPAPQRDETIIQCPYFSKCSGCQFQMLPYDNQLKHKTSIVEKAYRNFSNLNPELIPAIGKTVESPLQYGYRTKLTPHFDGPPGGRQRKARRNGADRKGFDKVPPIGFMSKGTRKTLDIEDCPLGTDAVRLGLSIERARISAEISSFKKGATLLLRESTSRKAKSELVPAINNSISFNVESESVTVNSSGMENQLGTVFGPKYHRDGANDNALATYAEIKTCVTNPNAISTEFIDDFVFTNSAGAFFQNNNSILPKFTAYIRDHVLSKDGPEKPSPIKYLIDAYCGSGLFTITLSSLFSSSIGIDIATDSIAAAKKNAALNGLANASFKTADASAIFKEVAYPPDETAIVIDPSRKGCDNAFLQQLLHFSPRRVVYVSCNVHTQARDVGTLVTGIGSSKYEIESIRGFDFFPQTGHVEGVAVLARSP